jgi:hypothetical protein
VLKHWGIGFVDVEGGTCDLLHPPIAAHMVKMSVGVHNCRYCKGVFGALHYDSVRLVSWVNYAGLFGFLASQNVTVAGYGPNHKLTDNHLKFPFFKILAGCFIPRPFIVPAKQSLP